MPTGSQGGAYLPKTPYITPQVYPTTIVPGDGVLPIVAGCYWLTKGSAAAITLPAPTLSQVGIELIIMAGTAFAHVVTGTGLIDNGVTGGGKNAWTSAAFVGSSLTIVAMPNLHWIVTGQVLGTVA